MNKHFKFFGRAYRIWLFIFALLPMLIMLGLSFLDCEGVDFANSSLSIISFKQVGDPEAEIILAFVNSLLYALITTVVCIVLGYIIAYRIFKSKIKNKFLIITLMILPMWSNILLRINALKSILAPINIITTMFNPSLVTAMEEVTEEAEITLVGTPFAVILGLIVTYLPFMILTIYTALEKIEPSLEEAALDLGLTNTKKFWKVIVPLSSKGIVTGSIMVFLPCMSGFAIPEILGNGKIVLIGNVIDQMFKNMNYNAGSLLAVVILVFILGSILLVFKFDKDGETLI